MSRFFSKRVKSGTSGSGSTSSGSSGSGGGRSVDITAACYDYAPTPINFVSSPTGPPYGTTADNPFPPGSFGLGLSLAAIPQTGSLDPINAIGHTGGSGSTTIGFGTVGVNNVVGLNLDTAVAYFSADPFPPFLTLADYYICPAGSWQVPLHVTAASGGGSIGWSDCYVLLVNRFGGYVATIAHGTNIAPMLSPGSTHTANLSGVETNLHLGNAIIILFTFNYGGSSPPTFTPGSLTVDFTGEIVVTPLLAVLKPVTRHAAKMIAPASGSGSGARRKIMAIGTGCGEHSLAQVSGVTSSGSSGSGRRRVLEIPSCCNPAPGSGSSGSGTLATVDDECITMTCAGGVAAREFSFPTPAHLDIGDPVTIIQHTAITTWAGPPFNLDNIVGCPGTQKGCMWTGSPYTPYCVGTSRGTWVLVLTSATTLILGFSAHTCNHLGGQAIYTATLALPWNCESPVTLQWKNTCSDFIGWPLTILLSPY